MNKKLLAGLATVGLLAGGGAAALATAGSPAAATSTTAVSPSVSTVPAYGPLGSLVAKGTITQAQAAAIHNALRKDMRDHWPDMRKECNGSGTDHTPWMLEPGGPLDTVLGQLVKDGTITKTQASAVTSAYTQWMQTNGHHGLDHHGGGGAMMGGQGNGMMWGRN